MLFRPGNPDDRIHHHALDRDRQPNLGRDKSQIGVFGTDYTTPKTGCPTAGVIDTIFFRKVVPTGGNRQNFRHDLLNGSKIYPPKHYSDSFNFEIGINRLSNGSDLWIVRTPLTTATQLSGTSVKITALAPMRTLFPTFTPPIIFTPAPIYTLSPMTGAPGL